MSTIWTHRSEIEEDYRNTNHSLDVKRRRTTKHDEIDQCLYEWFLDRRRQDARLTGYHLSEQARSFSALLNVPFEPSNGWLDRFKKKFNISKHKVCGERGDVDLEQAGKWIDHILPKLISDYSPDCIYNCDETGLFYKMLPEYTLAVNGENCSGGKKSKERITILFCCNQDFKILKNHKNY